MSLLHIIGILRIKSVSINVSHINTSHSLHNVHITAIVWRKEKKVNLNKTKTKNNNKLTMVYYLSISHLILETTWPGLKDYVILAEGMVFEDIYL